MSNAHFGAFIGVDGKQPPLCSNATAGETQFTMVDFNLGDAFAEIVMFDYYK